MKRHLIYIYVGLLTFLIGVATPTLLESRLVQSSPRVEPSSSTKSADLAYRDVASYIADRVAALKGKVPGFESVDRAKISIKEYPFKPTVDYRHGVLRYKEIPNSEPTMVEPVYTEDGFTVTVWVVRGASNLVPGKPMVEIGPYKIHAGVYGPQRDRVEPVINMIVWEAAAHFNGKMQPN